MQCKIEGINHKGEGVARIDGKATFVPGAIPGEVVDIRLTDIKSRYNRAALGQILEPSDHRLSPVCPYYYDCGGCTYQHMDYQEQLQIKRQVVMDSLQRIGKISAPVNPVIGMDNPWRYRNKVTWHAIGDELGYYHPESHQLVPAGSCNLISHKMETLISALKKVLPELNFNNMMEITLRESSFNHEMMLILGKLKSSPSLKSIQPLTDKCSSIYAEVNSRLKLLYGQEYLVEFLHGVEFKLSPQSFFQINHQQTLKLIKVVLDYLHLSGRETILDAYCGVGSISLVLAKQAGSVLGVESNRMAVKDARENAQLNGINNCEFIAGNCEKVLPDLHKTFDAIVLDPPRSGCKPEVISAVAAAKAKSIVYVSCNPSTLARDLALFKAQGYNTSIVQPLDMFPQTYHVECVVLISRVKG